MRWIVVILVLCMYAWNDVKGTMCGKEWDYGVISWIPHDITNASIGVHLFCRNPTQSSCCLSLTDCVIYVDHAWR